MQSLLGARSGAAGAAAVVAAIVAVGTVGCSSGGSSSSSSSSTGTKVNALAELTASVSKMADAQQIKTYAADINLQVSGAPGAGSSSSGNFSISGTTESERQPTLLTEFDASSLEAAGENIGSMSDIVTPTALYMKMAMLSTALGKPWVELPFSELKGGSGLSQLLSQVQDDADPLSATALLGGATSAQTVGTGTVGGVPVTEVSGSEPISAGLSKLPASLRSSLGPEISQLGLSQVTFQVWIDGQHDIRKAVVKESGKTLNETMSFTVTGINQPVSISVPTASQIATIPASDLNLAGL